MDSRSSRRNSNFGRWVFVLISVFENASISPTTFCQQTLVNRSFVSCTEESRRNIYLQWYKLIQKPFCVTPTYVISTYKYNTKKKHCKLFEALMENQIFFWHSNFLHLIFQYLMHSMLLVLISCGAYQMIVSAVKMGLLIFCGLTFFLLVNFIGDNSIFDIQDFMLQMEG